MDDPFTAYQPSLLPVDGSAVLLPGFFSQKEADAYFICLSENVNWKQEPIKIFGRQVMQPRLTAWFGDKGVGYRYSGISLQAEGWHPVVHEINNRIARHCNLHFNGALLNFYRDGQDSMGWHRDNEKELGPEPVIASVSLGATRKFQFRHHVNRKTVVSVELQQGSLLLMSGRTQQCWEHRLPKATVTGGARINITFRRILLE